MTILNHPSALELSGNLTRFRISSAEAFTFVLKKGSEVLLSQVYNPGSTGIVEIDVREAVESKLSYLFQDASAIYEQANLVGTFTATIDATVITFTAIRSGVDRFADSATNFLTANFLTWQPQVKHVTYYSPEFLTYYSPAGGIAKLVAHYSDDTTEVLTIGSLASGKAYTIPLQYASVNALLTKKLPSYYDVYVTNAGGDRLSYIQRFAASNIKSEDERWFLFENSLGGLDTIRAYGADGFTGEHTHNIADIDEVAEEYRVDTSRIYSKNTGYLDDYERRWLLDFFPSKKKYVYTQSAARQIVVTESDVDYNSKDLPSAYSFKYRFSEAKPYLNLSRVDEIPDEITLYTPDVGSFTLPLRLNDLPHIELTEGALIPGQNPYSEHAGVFSVAELIAYLKSGEQLDVAFVKRSATGATIEGNGKVFDVDVDADGNLVFNGNIYATGSVSALGVGVGGGGTSYNRLDTWAAYIPGTTDTWVLSALLGHDLHTRVTALEEDTPNVAWGVPTTDYVPLTVNAASRQLSVHGHGHTFASLSSKPTTISGYGITDSLIYEGDARLTNSRPASDVSSWAKAANKPTYSYTEVGAAAASHYHDDRYFQKGELFTKEGSGTEADPYRIRANFPFYGISSVAALGVGSGGGGTSYDRLDSWTGYDVDQAGWVLSAGLGHDTYTRVLALEASTPNVAWGVPTTDYIPLTVNAISRQLSIHGHGHTFASLTSKPTTIAGYGITDSLIYEGDARLTNSRPASDVSSWAKAANKPSYAFSEITSKPTSIGGYGITDAILLNDTIQNTNTFGGRKLYISSLDNALGGADKKYYVIATRHKKIYNSETYPKAINVGNILLPQWEDSPVVSTLNSSDIFRNNYDAYIECNSDEYIKVRLDFSLDGTAYFPGFPYGTYYLSYYYTFTPDKAEVRCYNNYAPNTTGYKTGSFSNYIGNNAGSGFVQKYTDSGNYQRREIEFIIYGHPSHNTRLAEIEWKLDRPYFTSHSPIFSNYGTNKSYQVMQFGTQADNNVTINPNGTVSALNFTENGVNLSSKYAAIAQTHYVGTTAIAANRASAAQSLTGITSIDGSAAKLTTPRALTIGATAKNFDGSAAVSWSATELGLTTSDVLEGTNYYFTSTRVLGVALGTITTTNEALATGISISTAMNRIQGQINARALIAGASTQDFATKNLTVAGTASVTGLLTASGNIKTANVDGAYMQVGPIKILYDATNGAIRVEGNLYATGSNTAFGIGGGAGGGGLITNVYSSAGFGGTYSDVDLSSTFNAYAINSLYTALQGKQATITGAVSTLVSSNLYANYALVSGATGKIQASGVTATELSYLSGASSNIQTQLNAKPSVNSYPTAFSWNAGSTSGPTATISGSNMTAISVAAIPEASGTESGIVTTGAQSFSGEKSFNSSVWLAGTNALVLDGASQSIYSHEQGGPVVTYNNDTGVTTHHWKNIFEGLVEVKTGNALTFALPTQSNGSIAFANGADGYEFPTIIGKSTSGAGTGLFICAGTSNVNTNSDMLFSVRQQDNNDYSDLTKNAFRWSRYATNLMTLGRNGLLTLLPAINSISGASQRVNTHEFSLNSTNTPTYSTRRTDSGVGMILMSMVVNNNQGGTDMMFNVREQANADFSASYLTRSAFRWDRYGTTLMNLLRNGNLSVIGSITAMSLNVSAMQSAPSSASAAGTTGEIRFTSTGLFICIATNTWRKATISTF